MRTRIAHLALLIPLIAWAGCFGASDNPQLGDDPGGNTNEDVIQPEQDIKDDSNKDDSIEPDPVDDSERMNWTRKAALTTAASCEEAEDWIEEAVITEMIITVEQNRRCALSTDGCGYPYPGYGYADSGITEPSVDDEAGGTSDKETPEDYSETNTQVEGVDEADTVKTDGNYIYVLSNNDLVVVKSWPARESEEVGRVTLSVNPMNFFLKGNQAIVLGSANLHDLVEGVPTGERDQGTEPAGGGTDIDAAMSESEGAESGYPDYYYDYRPVTTLTIVDLTDKANPKEVETSIYDGYLMDSRRIEAKTYMALNKYISIYLPYWPDELDWIYYGSQQRPSPETINAAFDALIERNIKKIKSRTLIDWLPHYWTAKGGAKAQYSDGEMLASCEDLYAPSVYSGIGLLGLVTVDVDSGDLMASIIQGNWGNVYASLEAVYVASTNYYFYDWWRDAEDKEIPPISTHIHKFAFDDDGFARYSASGKVLGYAINQFAFDEYKENLRVATTEGTGWWSDQESESRVTILEEKEGELVEVGMVGGLGKGEQIYSVRFIGDQGYVVTFRQVDPLYVIDLSDPAAPKVTGELKIPGYSSYIHPLEPGFLLTAGRDGDEEGRVGGIKIEIFDVSDPSDPKSVKTAVIGDGWDTWSDVLYDHKAFNYFKARNLLAIPVSGWVETNDGGQWVGEYKSQLALFKVTKEDIEVLPFISHMDFINEFGGRDDCRYYNGYWQAHIYRSVFVEDYVYSLSRLGLLIHDTRDFEEGAVASVKLLDPEEFGYYDWDSCGYY